MARKPIDRQGSEKEQGINNPLGKRLYTLKEAAEYLGRSDWSMRELIWGGKIPVVRGDGARKIFLDIKDLDEYIGRNKSTYQ
jgi:excisionase family DNA binding protein